MATTPPQNFHSNQTTVTGPAPPDAPKKKNPVISRAHLSESEAARRKLDFDGGGGGGEGGGGDGGGGGGGGTGGGGALVGGSPMASSISKMNSSDR